MTIKCTNQPFSKADELIRLKIKNIGDGVAKNVITHQMYYIDNDIAIDNKKEQLDIESDQTVRLRCLVTDPTFLEVWERKRKLKLKLQVSYTDDRNENYIMVEYAEYDPKPNERVFSPSWIRDSN